MSGMVIGNLSVFVRKYRTTFLAFFWIAGLICGLKLYLAAGSVTDSLMLTASAQSASVLNLLVCSLLPFLLSAAAVYLDRIWIFYGLAFCKSCLLSFFSLSILEAFGSAGWLVRLFLLFSDSFLCVVLYLYWLRHFTGNSGASGVRAFSYASWIILVGSVDVCLVSPLLGRFLE